jgi:hypothetical protein
MLDGVAYPAIEFEAALGRAVSVPEEVFVGNSSSNDRNEGLAMLINSTPSKADSRASVASVALVSQ